MILVVDDVLLQDRLGRCHLARLRERLARQLVNGDLGPDQDPVAIGQFLDLWADGIMRPDHRRAERLDPVDQLGDPVYAECCALRKVLLVQVDAAEVQRPAVELQTAANDRAQVDLAQNAAVIPPLSPGPGGRSVGERRLSTRTTNRLTPGRRPLRSSSNGRSALTCDPTCRPLQHTVAP